MFKYVVKKQYFGLVDAVMNTRMYMLFASNTDLNNSYKPWVLSCEFESHSWRGVLDAKLCGNDNVCQWLAADRWLSLGTPVSSTNKTDRYDITEISLTVALNTITLTLTILFHLQCFPQIIYNARSSLIYLIVSHSIYVWRWLIGKVCSRLTTILIFLTYVLYIVVYHFVLFSIYQYFVFSSSIYGFWLPLWYRQTLLSRPDVYFMINASIHDRGVSCPNEIRLK